MKCEILLSLDDFVFNFFIIIKCKFIIKFFGYNFDIMKLCDFFLYVILSMFELIEIEW